MTNIGLMYLRLLGFARVAGPRSCRGDPERGALPKAPIGATLRPSWDEVDEYLREGKHRRRVEHYATGDPDFAERLRWMRNDLEADARVPPPSRVDARVAMPVDAPPSSGRGARRSMPPPRASSTIPPPPL